MSIAVTAKDSWVVGARTFKGNPYDGHTLEEAFDQILRALALFAPEIYNRIQRRSADFYA